MNETNELTEVRALFDSPPAPAPQVVAAARDRLTEDDAAAPRRALRTALATRLQESSVWLRHS